MFQQPEPLLAAVSRINESTPQVQWSSPACAVSNALLWRRTPGGTYDIRAYSGTVRVANDSGSPARFRIRWTGYDSEEAPPRQVLRDGMPFPEVEIEDHAIRITVDMQAGGSHIFTLVHGNSHGTLNGLGFRRTLRGFVRRRLSEVRDSHLSKKPALLRAAEAFQKHILR